MARKQKPFTRRQRQRIRLRDEADRKAEAKADKAFQRKQRRIDYRIAMMTEGCEADV